MLRNWEEIHSISLYSLCVHMQQMGLARSFPQKNFLPVPVEEFSSRKFPDWFAALNPHFMLVNYTGAAGDLPGEIPRKIGPRGRKIRPLDLWPWSEKLHFVIPGRLRTFGSEPGRTCATDTF